MTSGELVCALAFALRRKAAGNEWVMIAFSKLGFIGKTFRSSRHRQNRSIPLSALRSLARLPKLAEFLLAFHDQVPLPSLAFAKASVLARLPATG